MEVPTPRASERKLRVLRFLFMGSELGYTMIVYPKWPTVQPPAAQPDPAFNNKSQGILYNPVDALC